MKEASYKAHMIPFIGSIQSETMERRQSEIPRARERDLGHGCLVGTVPFVRGL